MDLKGVGAFALLLTAAFVFLAAAHSPSMATILVDDSVLQQPTEAGTAVAVERGGGKKQVKEEEICCDNCSICTRSMPPKCRCADVVKDCPSWCKYCVNVNGGKTCMDLKKNYCEKKCDYSHLL